MSNRRKLSDQPQVGKKYPVPLRESAIAVAPGGTLTVDRSDPARLTEAKVSDTAWSQFGAGDYTPEQWVKACLIHLPAGDGQDPNAKELHKLPVREPSGALNRNAVHAAAGGHGVGSVKSISADQKRAAAKAIIRLYGQLKEDPPASLKALAVQTESAVAGAVNLCETTAAAVLDSAGQSGATQLVQLIDAGWGTSGYYSPDVLVEAARQRVFPAGLPLYIDHPTVTEESERPGRSVRDMAAVLAEDAYYEPTRRGLVARVNVFPDARQTLAARRNHIGLSIRADGTAEYGEAEGRRGPIVSAITEASSVDYVTRAGRGGRILALLESGRAVELRESRSIGTYLESKLHTAWTVLADELYGDGRLTRPERITLSSAVGDAMKAFTDRVEADAAGVYQRDLYDDPEPDSAPDDTSSTADAPAPLTARVMEAATEDIRRALSDLLYAAYADDNTHVWVRDYDADKGLVWYETTGPDACTTWQEGYRIVDGLAQLTGGRIEVVARTVYVPDPPDRPGTEQVETGTATTGTRSALGEAAATDVTDGAPPTAPNPTTETEGSMSETTTTGPAPGAQAGTDTAAVLAGLSEATTARDAALREAADSKAAAQTAAAQAAEATAKLTESQAETKAAQTELARFRAIEQARPIAATVLAESTLPAAARNRIAAAVTLSAQVPLTEAGVLDETALKATLASEITAETAYLAQLAEADGQGTVRGLGTQTSTATSADTATATKNLQEAYAARGLSPEAAKFAAAGRPL